MTSSIDSLGLLSYQHDLQASQIPDSTDSDPSATTDTKDINSNIINLINSIATDLLLPYSQYNNLLQCDYKSLSTLNTTQSVMIDSIPYIDHSTMVEIGDYGVWYVIPYTT